MSTVGESFLTPPLHGRETDHDGLRYLFRLIDFMAIDLVAATTSTEPPSDCRAEPTVVRHHSTIAFCRHNLTDSDPFPTTRR